MNRLKSLAFAIVSIAPLAADAGVIANARITNLMMDKNYGEKVFLELSRDHASVVY